MKIKTASLIGAQLDWAVAKCEGIPTAEFIALQKLPESDDFWKYHYSTSWAQGGPIIEREHIGLISPSSSFTMFWTADIGLDGKFTQFDHSPLVAAMRCYVASELGDEVDVPEELCE